MFRLVIKTGERRVHVLELQSGLNLLGRLPENDIPLDHEGVSGRHCALTIQSEQVLVQDLGSTNGTWVDGQPVGKNPEQLRPGQCLKLGELEMVLEDRSEAVRVSVPSFTEEKGERKPPETSEGQPACMKHPEQPAIWRCERCGYCYCNECVHHLRRVGGKFHTLCPRCSHHCHLLESARKPEPPRFFARLKKWLKRTVRLKP